MLKKIRQIRRKIMRRADEIRAPHIYRRWIRRYDSPTAADREKIRRDIESFSAKPLISILLPVYNVEEKWLRLCLDSVLRQSYENWELCIADDRSPAAHIAKVLREYAARDERIKIDFREMNGHISAASNSALALATGEFCALLDHDDELDENALFYIARELNRFPETDLIYTDEDMIDAAGSRYNPNFKPDFSRDLLYSLNLVTHLAVYRTQILRAIDGFRAGVEGSQDYDLTLRFIEKTRAERIRHIPKILYHWRAIQGSVALASNEKSYAHERARIALREYFARQNVDADVTKGFYEFHCVRYFPPEKTKISIICAQAETANFSENSDCEIKIVKDIDAKSFDEAAAKATGEVLIFFDGVYTSLNDDSLRELASLAMQPEIGAAGAKIFSPSGDVRNAGIILGGEKVLHFAHRGLSGTAAGNLQRAQVINNFSAISGVLAIRRELFDRLGGFDAANFPRGLFDVDLCLRLGREGFRIVFTPYAEFVQTGDSTTEKILCAKNSVEIENFRRIWKKEIERDAFYNPNFSLRDGRFRLAFPPRERDADERG